ncbi:MAG: asparagine synthase (glutamine-hydrolyzing) [Thermodesulfobacteriota bacterium]
MCGIVGFCSCNKKIDEAILTSMRDALTHRGPDDAGIYVDVENNVGLGHKRLSILDLSSLGHQPMSNDNGSIWITYNGEVYNFKEIREELKQRGYSFKSNSDTEVVIKSYEEWGIDCVHKFIGMFALGIWDKREKKLYLLRDRVGVKPLYYYHKDGLFLFGSELKALMKHPNFDKEVDFSILPLYLRYGYIPAPFTIFKNTYKLRPGHYLCVFNDIVKEVKYWDIVDFYLEEPINLSEDEITEELENLLVDSFKYRLVSDVPVGVFLSGGIDSTTLTALLQKNISTQLKTFSIGFYEENLDEAKWAKKIANYLETDHTEYYLSVKEALSIIQKLPEIYDEPFGDSSGIPTYLVSRLARQDVTVTLSADGGDELFCGYNRYKSVIYLNRWFLRLPRYIRNSIIKALSSFTPSKVDFLYGTFKPLMPEIKDHRDKFEKWRNMLRESSNGNPLDMYKFNINRWTPDDLTRLLGYQYNSKFTTYFEETFFRLKNNDLVTQVMAVDFKTWLVDDILTKVDRATMSVGLEAREPFLDHRLVQYVARIPIDLKYKNGMSKYILRKILYKYVPRELLERPKQGFVVPLAGWLKGELSSLVMNYLNEDRLKKEGIFNPAVVSSCVKDFMNGSINVNKIWFLLMFEMWKEKWV